MGDALATERLELVAKATHDVIWDWDLRKNTIWWNAGMQTIFGYEQETKESDLDSWYTRIHPDDRERVLSNIHLAITNGEANWSDHYRFLRANGSYAYIHDRGYTISDQTGAIRMVGSMQDVTEQVKLQEAQKESQERLSFALRSAQLGTWDLDPANGTVKWDDRCSELFGFLSNPNPSYEDAIKVIHYDDQSRVNSSVQQALSGENEGSINIQFRTVGSDDHILRWLHCKGQAYFDDNGELHRFSGILQDISDQIHNQEKAYFADQQATMTIEGTGAGSFLVDIKTNEIVYSPTMAKILTGEIAEDLSRSAFISHIHPEDVHIRSQAYKLAAESGELNYEARYIWNDDSVHWIKVIGRYLYDKTGNRISLSGIVFDISDRVETEQKLKASEEHLRTMIEQAPVATALFVGRDLVIEIPNEAMLKLWGKGDTVTGKPLKEALPELIGQPFFGILEDVFTTGNAYHAEGAPGDIMIDGKLQRFYFDYTYKPLRNRNGEIYAILDMAVDVTDQVISGKNLKKSEEQYKQLADELELRVQQRTNELKISNQELTNSNNNLQQFAYAASHDMQEPLRKIQSFSSRLQNTYLGQLDANGIFMLNRMQDAANRMSLMIDDLLTYSRLTTNEVKFESVNLKRVVEEVISDLEVGIEEQQAVISVEPLPEVYGNHRQLVQLVQNLVSNSIKYRRPDQAPKVNISAADVDAAEVAHLPGILKGQKYVRLEFSDNGIGFDEKYLDRIFQMFQRLHGRSEFAGSGIGLALCKKVVQNHHGYITARSVPGEGSVFIVYLPTG